jgi:hypothetical protein
VVSSSRPASWRNDASILPRIWSSFTSNGVTMALLCHCAIQAFQTQPKAVPEQDAQVRSRLSRYTKRRHFPSCRFIIQIGRLISICSHISKVTRPLGCRTQLEVIHVHPSCSREHRK